MNIFGTAMCAQNRGHGKSRDASDRARQEAAGAAFPEFHKEHPEAPQFDPVTTGHCSGYLCKNDIDDPLRPADSDAGSGVICVQQVWI
jgi:hypothetical protein